MNTKLVLTVAAAALALAPASALAQSASPAPAASPVTAPAPQPTTPMMQTTAAPSPATSAPAPAATSAPAPAATSAPVTAPAPNPTTPPSVNGGGNANGNNGKHLGQVKKIQTGTLSTSDLRYALTHPTVELGKVRKMKSISFDKLRVYKLSSGLKSMLKVSDANDDLPFIAMLSPSIEVAQTNGSNSPIAALQYVLANINVSNALNNVSVLNNSNVNVGVTLADVLNGNKISIGQVAGIFVNGLGIITTITK
jgi:hypothetical protein